MGGTIRLITKKPDAQEFSAAARAEYSTVSDGDNGLMGWGVVNVPLISDKLALRLTGSTQDIVGWVDVPDLGKTDTNDGRQDDFRAALRWNPIDKLTLDFSYAWQQLKNNSSAATSPGVYLPSEQDPVMQPVLQISTRDSEYDLWNVTANYDLGFASLVFSASMFDQTRELLTDLTPTVTRFFGPLGTDGTATEVGQFTVETQTQELRLVSNGDQRLNWTVGAYFKDDERIVDDSGYIISLPAIGLVDDQALTFRRATADAWALFGDIEFKLTDTVALQAGVRRYDADTDDLIRFETTSLIFGLVAGESRPSSASYAETLPKIGMSWTPRDDLMLYAKYSEGFRDGGSNYQAPDYEEIVATFDPEKVEAYEVGVKSLPFDWLTVNASIYSNEFIQNAGKARSTGGEIEMTARPTRGLRLGLNLGYVDAEIDEDVFNALGVQIATKGNAVPYSPEFQTSISAAYDFPVASSLNGSVSMAYSYRDEMVSDAANTDVLRNDSHDSLFLRAGIDAAHWGIGIYVSNATDSDATVSKTPFAGAGPAAAYGTYVQPRTVGLELTASF
jgi:iron complex outermembrane receptor protein